MTLKEIISASQVVTFEAGKKYIVFVDQKQIDPASITSLLDDGDVECDVIFIPVRTLPDSSEFAVKVYEEIQQEACQS